MANSRWNMSTHVLGGFGMDKSLNTKGDEIWYGVFDMHTSKLCRPLVYIETTGFESRLIPRKCSLYDIS